MNNILIKNIKELVQIEDKPRKWVAGAEMGRIETLRNAWLLISGEKIAAYGKMDQLSASETDTRFEHAQQIDASGRMVFPAFCDSHTH